MAQKRKAKKKLKKKTKAAKKKTKKKASKKKTTKKKSTKKKKTTKKKTTKKKSTKKKTKAKKKTTKKKSKKKLSKKKSTKKTANKKKKAGKKPQRSKKTSASSSRRKKVSRLTQRASTPNTASAPVPPTMRNQVNVGDLAPDFSLKDQNGNLVSLSQFRGKKVVLYFYPKDDTPGCTREACSFRDHLSQFQGMNAEILGVSFDDEMSHQKFKEKYGLNFTLLCDTEKEVANKFGVYVQKNMYGKTYMGIQRSTFVIDTEGRISQIFRNVKVDGHTEEVISALEEAA